MAIWFGFLITYFHKYLERTWGVLAPKDKLGLVLAGRRKKADILQSGSDMGTIKSKYEKILIMMCDIIHDIHIMMIIDHERNYLACRGEEIC